MRGLLFTIMLQMWGGEAENREGEIRADREIKG